MRLLPLKEKETGKKMEQTETKDEEDNIVNSQFLQRPQKRSRGNQFILQGLIKAKINKQRLRSKECGREREKVDNVYNSKP